MWDDCIAIAEAKVNAVGVSSESRILKNRIVSYAVTSCRLLQKLMYASTLQGHPEVDSLRRSYSAWLIETKQNEKAGEMKESEGDYVGAVNFYLKAGLPAKAAWLAMNRDELLSGSIVSRITSALIKEDFYERVSHGVHVV